MNDLRLGVSFPLEDGGVDAMYVSKRSDGLLILDNSPFYAYGISNGDVLSAETSEGGGLVFLRVEERGGHSTYRVKLLAGRQQEAFLEYWRELEALGCTYEGTGLGPERLYSIDIPVGSSVDEVYRVLEEGESDGYWTFEEGHYYIGH